MDYGLVLDKRGTAVHYIDIVKLIGHFEVGNKYRMALVWLLYGGRPSELENLSRASFFWNDKTKKFHCIWKPRKNQRGFAQPGSPLPEPEQIWDKAQEDVNAGKQKTLRWF